MTLHKLMCFIVILLFLAGCDGSFIDKHQLVIDEFRRRGNWNMPQKDFILRVEYVYYDTKFTSSFIVHSISREEEYSRNMETITINKDGLVKQSFK